ncbi:hypothetical protein BSL78_05820 [Apostichopus japonicus]|uniref:Uncharacterized protein n=1 Tax=Stichopus japonicus TaxID=307972 RepID=A0A2G8LAS0_STIJA|nr:hypothetical protein BSL78_05820 [Apostichopus japonicus]
MATTDPATKIQFVQEATVQLKEEIGKMRNGEYKKLYSQTRSFIDALQRSPNGQNTTYGPSVVSIRQVRECLEHSKSLDGEERITHFTILLECFLSLMGKLQELVQRVNDWIREPINELTVHDKQWETNSNILKETEFWARFVDEIINFTDLHKFKTLEKFRGLNTGEVALWGAVVNLVPVLMKTAEDISKLATKWINITYKIGMGIYNEATREAMAKTSRKNSAERTPKTSIFREKRTPPAQREQEDHQDLRM